MVTSEMSEKFSGGTKNSKQTKHGSKKMLVNIKYKELYFSQPLSNFETTLLYDLTSDSEQINV